MIWEKIKLVTVEPVLFLYMMIIFLESNAITNLIYVKSCFIRNPDLSNFSDCSFHKKGNFTSDIIDTATSFIRLNDLVLFSFTFLGSFFVASWSDKFGRKFTMLIPPLGTLFAASINSALSAFIKSSAYYLFISSAISGISFGTVGIISSTFGFISDLSNESTRTRRMFILEAMIYFGGTIGIYIAGEFLRHEEYDFKTNGFTKLFIFEVAVAAFITLYIIFRIPNRSDEREMAPISCGNLFKLDHIKDAIKTIFRRRDAGKRKVVLLLLLAIFVIYFGGVVMLTLAYLYLKTLDETYWSFHQYSVFNAAQFGIEGAALVLGMPILCYLFHVPDHIIVMLGIVSKMSGYILFGLSKSSVMVYSCIALLVFAEYPIPAIRSILSKTVDVDERGRIFAFTTILQNFCFFIGSLTLTSIFKASSSFFPGLCFELVAGLQFIALCIIIYLYVTRGEIITTYVTIENEDGTTEESCVVARRIGIND